MPKTKAKKPQKKRKAGSAYTLSSADFQAYRGRLARLQDKMRRLDVLERDLEKTERMAAPPAARKKKPHAAAAAAAPAAAH